MPHTSRDDDAADFVGIDDEGDDDDDDDDDDHDQKGHIHANSDSPVELHFQQLSRVRSATMPAPTDYLAVPNYGQSRSTPTSPSGGRLHSPLPRPLSNLAAEDEHFKGHRDSFDLYNSRREKEERLNQQLMATRDSFLLTRSKYDSRFARTAGGPVTQWSRFGGLSPIMDASPPDAKIERGLKAMSKLAQEQKVHEEPHADEHVGCSICEVERPRWFEANCKKGWFV